MVGKFHIESGTIWYHHVPSGTYNTKLIKELFLFFYQFPLPLLSKVVVRIKSLESFVSGFCFWWHEQNTNQLKVFLMIVLSGRIFLTTKMYILEVLLINRFRLFKIN
jgi:hypothetical protein